MSVNVRVALIVLPVVWACKPDTSRKPVDEKETATGAAPVQSSGPYSSQPPAAAPSKAQQLTAQDTIFEDGTKPSSWRTAGFDDPTGFKEFVVTFQDWVRKDNVDSIVAHIQFPLPKYKTAEEFRRDFANIFDARMKESIEKQRLDRIFRNADGAMVGNGHVWFSPMAKGYRIIAINPSPIEPKVQ
jgi:hypothetical protein